MMCRNFLFGQGKTTLYPTGSSSIASLSPDLAVVDGLGDAMAATLLTTPWLTDTTTNTALTPRDIRVIPAQPGIGSPATLAALGWQLSLAATSTPSPGTYANWSAPYPPGPGLTDPYVMTPFFTLINPSFNFLDGKTTLSEQFDVNSIYAQVSQLLQPQQAGSPVNLASIFNNSNLLALLEPYGIIWPQSIQAWPYVTANWDTSTPVNEPQVLLPVLPSFTLSMAAAQQIPNLGAPGTTVYPNSSQGEVAFAKLASTYDQNFSLSITASYQSGGSTVPGLPPGATIEVVVDDAITPSNYPVWLQPKGPFLFTAASMNPVSLTLRGNPTDVNNPVWHWVRFRILSPTTLQPDVLVTPVLTLIPNS
jgi:hypothetical protein